MRRSIRNVSCALAACAVVTLCACGQGEVTATASSEAERDYAGIAGPGDPAQLRPVELHDRDSFGAENNFESLGYPGSGATERALFDAKDPHSPLGFFTTEHTDDEGVGPLFNQRRCLGCHGNSGDNDVNIEMGGLAIPSPARINRVNTPVSRAGRQGITDHAKITREAGNPPTAAFTLYGDFAPGSGVFDPLAPLGGPLQHVHAVGECNINQVPPMSIDPNLQGGIDPVTGLSASGFRREIGERAAPPYIGRGLMEAIHVDELAAGADPEDRIAAPSSLAPQPDRTICPGDCISGRQNIGLASVNFVGGDPIQRPGRFGLRGAGTTLLQFDVGGTQGELGMTSPFSPVEQPNFDSPNRSCDRSPDPELSTEEILNLRNLIRNIAVPRQHAALYEDPPQSELARDVQAGAVLFGIDLDAFRSRMTPGATPARKGDANADHGIAADRQLGCVSCHTPIQKTGQSPARLGGEHLSNRWAPIFSDLLIHKNPELPPGDARRLDPPIPGNISRNLADYAVPPPVTGIANGNEFRTPPLMGLGMVGPPFGHDARVYLNVTGGGNYPGDPPNPPAETVFTSADEGTRVLKIDSFERAVLAAIELHDLPAPPDNDYSRCPRVSPDRDICSRESPWRGEARNVMEKFRRLTGRQQMQVVRFLLAL